MERTRSGFNDKVHISGKRRQKSKRQDYIKNIGLIPGLAQLEDQESQLLGCG